MLQLAIALGILAAVYLAIRAFAQANPATLARRARTGGGIGALALAAILALRGNLAVSAPLASLAAWLIWGQGAPGWLDRMKRSGPAPGPVSRVATDHLEMELDTATGAMRGRVLKGFFAGRDLESLRPVELAHLWQDCRFVDPASAQLVEAYLDRVHPTWREDLARAEAATPKGPDGRMTRAEAFEILGLAAGAGEDEIREAHRKLMLKLHPDRGGSTYLAAKINEAKEVALAGRPAA